MTNIEHRFPEIDFKLDSLEELPDIIQQLQRDGDRVVPVRYDRGTAWLVTGFKDNADLLGNDEQVPAGPHYSRELDTFGKTLLHMQGDEHRRHKASFTPLLSVGAVRRMVESLLVPLANQVLDRIGAHREIDLYVEFASPYSFNVISQVLGLEIPREDEGHFIDILVAALQTKDVDGASSEERRERANASVVELNAFLDPIIRERRENPGTDLISFLTTGTVAGRTIDDGEIRDYIRHTFVAGFDTTGLQIANVLWTILSREGLKERLIEKPELRSSVVEEATRVSPVTGLLARTTYQDTLIGDVEVPAGSTVLLGVPGANRDVNAFPDPDGNFAGGRANPNLTFGRGTHFCLGTHLAKEELRVSLDVLLARLPGLRFAGPQKKMSGSMIRHVPDLRIAFDELLPAPAQ